MECVSLEVAKKLAENGLIFNCLSFYAKEDFVAEYIDDCGDMYECDFEKDDLCLNYPINWHTHKDKFLPAPRLDDVLEFFRNKKDTWIVPCPNVGQYVKIIVKIYIKIDNMWQRFYSEEIFYDTYEDAVNYTILNLLENPNWNFNFVKNEN